MDASGEARVLWAGPKASPHDFTPGFYELVCATPASAALGEIEKSQANGSPFAICFLSLAEEDLGAVYLDNLVRVNPDLYLIVENVKNGLLCPCDLGAWANPDRCILLSDSLSPFIRKGFAEHLAVRWRNESREKNKMSLLEDEARRHKQSQEQYKERLGVLYGIIEKLHEASSLEKSLEITLGEMSRFLGAQTGSLMLLDDKEKLRVVEAVGPHRHRICGMDVNLKDSRISRFALEERKPILVEDIQKSDRFRDSEEGVRFRTRSILCVPLFAEGKSLGVLNFGGAARKTPFTEYDRDLIVTLGRQVSVALERARLVERLRRAAGEAIRALVGAIEAKDPYTRGHSDRVTHYSSLIAQSLGLGDNEVNLIVRSAILHDVGKIAVPGIVLNKPGRLTNDEFLLIKNHPDRGVEIVREIKEMSQTLSTIRSHHERFDGKGYPLGLKGEDIPLGARVLAIADTYDAMTSNRPYRQGLPAATAFEEIKRCAGSQFDPEIAEIFLSRAACWPDLNVESPDASDSEDAAKKETETVHAVQ